MTLASEHGLNTWVAVNQYGKSLLSNTIVTSRATHCEFFQQEYD